MLPSETQIGANTIGFKANGKIYTASGNTRQLLSMGHVSYVTGIIDSSIFISAARIAGENQFQLWLTIKYKDTIGRYLLSDGDYKGTFFFRR